MRKPQTRAQVGAVECRIVKQTVELRAAEGEAPQISGYGAVFNTETVICGYFREKILPGAFADSLANDDVRVAFNHSPDYILGRMSAKTAQITEDDNGLRYVAQPPDTTWAKDLATSIKRRDITGSSFQFLVEDPDGDEWDYSETKKGMLPLRTIKRATLIECGPVSYPAYEETTTEARDRASAGAAARETNETCAACHGSGLNPERAMSDPQGQAPCQACGGKGTRAAAESLAAETAERQALAGLDMLERELTLDELEARVE